MKTPRKNLKARSAVVSRKSSPASPAWTSAKDVFKSPKSPSPVRRVTRRTSVYQSKSSDAGKFRMPLPKMLSPPGVKTRARRSSIYQKGGGRLISPPKATQTRRTSMYLSSKSRPEMVTVFSKVWATPVRQPEAVTEKSPEKPVEKKASTQACSPLKTEKSPKSTNRSVSKVSEGKTKTPKRSISPKKTSKTPGKAVNKSKTKGNKIEMAKSVSPKETFKTPKAVNKSKAAESKAETPSMSSQKKSKKMPKSAESENDTPKLLEQKQSKKATSSKKRSPTRASPKQLKTPGPKSARKSSKPIKDSESLPDKVKAAAQSVTSTPTKSLEQITGKSFYSTPGETPIPSQRTDDVFVFSAKPANSANRSIKKPVHVTPVETPVKKSRTPKRMPTRKTPAVKRSRQNNSMDFVEGPVTIPPAKRLKATPKARPIKSAKRSVKKVSTLEEQTKDKLKLSPGEMSSVLRSVVRTEKRQASKSPSPRRAKRTKVLDTDLRTPRVIRTVKRTSPKKLAEIVSVSQNTNNNAGSDGSMMNMTLLNDTINTDSRISRCIIL